MSTSACFVVGYSLSLGSALQILKELWLRFAAGLHRVLLVAGFSELFILVPAARSSFSVAFGHRTERRAAFCEGERVLYVAHIELIDHRVAAGRQAGQRRRYHVVGKLGDEADVNVTTWVEKNPSVNLGSPLAGNSVSCT